jgi:hypothetical protein
MSFTVVPLHNLDLPAGSEIPFGPKFVLQDVPEWLRRDTEILRDIGRAQRDLTLAARHALVSEYEADSLGFPDPEWKGPTPRSIQKLRFQSAFLANTALWLSQPSAVCFTTGFHALTRLSGGQTIDPLSVIQTEHEGPYYCHPKDSQNPVLPKHVIRAARLCELLETVPRRNPVWASLRNVSAALLSYFPDYRYPLFWQALESLFTSETKTWKVTERLCERISFFLADNAKDQRALFNKVKTCYDTRSKILHGRWDEGPELEDRTADTEAIVRTAIRHILEKPGMLGVFISQKRDEFLDAWVDSKSFMPPPMPNCPP